MDAPKEKLMRCNTAVISCAILLVASLVPRFGMAQETETLLGGDMDIDFALGLESGINKIQDDLSASWGFYAGLTVNQATTFALTLAANLTHPTVNYGYFGAIARHTLRQENVVHGGASLLLAAANTKDYEREKSSLFDNFGNTSGESFYFVEPSLFGELNVTESFQVRLGVGYRFAWGLDETTDYTSRTGVTQDDFSGLSFMVGVGWQ
jgi:hypothetical protein